MDGGLNILHIVPLVSHRHYTIYHGVYLEQFQRCQLTLLKLSCGVLFPLAKKFDIISLISKAKRSGVYTLHSGNLYQIFTYVKNKDAEFGDEPHRVSGMLLYAATDKAIQPDNSYRMSGNQISVKTLDLNLDFSEIAAQLNAIVDKHFG